MYKVYAVQHKATGRIYVGSTKQKDISNRIMQHIWMLRRGEHPIELMQEDFNRYGENYDFFNLGEYKEYADNNYVSRQKEYDYMEKFGTDNPAVGYNYNDRYFNKKKNQLDIKDGEPIPNEITLDEEDE